LGECEEFDTQRDALIPMHPKHLLPANFLKERYEKIKVARPAGFFLATSLLCAPTGYFPHVFSIDFS
jgi:hypothetical protein